MRKLFVLSLGFFLIQNLSQAQEIPEAENLIPEQEEIPQVPSRKWIILKDKWAPVDEAGFSNFIYRLAKAGCRNINSCLKNPANPFRSSDPSDMSFHTDCGKFPYVLRAYYAWKNHLPFSMSAKVRSLGSGGDLRYTAKGNVVEERFDVFVRRPGEYPDGPEMLSKVISLSLTSLYRMSVRFGENERLKPDFYPVKVTRQGIKAGTLIYDADGHAMMTYEVLEDGRVHIFESGVDGSLANTKYYSVKIVRTGPDQSGGFKNWRPVSLNKCSKDRNGVLVCESLSQAKNSEIPLYSNEQFVGTETEDLALPWRKAEFNFKNEHYGNFHEFVRARLALGNLEYEPVKEFTNQLKSLCESFADRAYVVNESVHTKRMNLKSHPARLPDNIYGTDGEWEIESTPARDSDIKIGARAIRQTLEKFLNPEKRGSMKVKYDGSIAKMQNDLKLAYLDFAKNGCQITYKKSDGQNTVTLGMDDLMDRIFLMSFDPYNCIERRWGAQSVAELSGCTDGAEKKQWYIAEQALRSLVDRDYKKKMNHTASELIEQAQRTPSILNPSENIDFRELVK